MGVAIRLKRKGRKKVPFYRIIVIDSRKRRDGCEIEDLGWFNPLNDEMVFNLERFNHWFSLGAVPSDRVLDLSKKAK